MPNCNRWLVEPDAYVFWGTTLLCSLTLFF
jgi:hypothetical protein